MTAPWIGRSLARVLTVLVSLSGSFSIFAPPVPAGVIVHDTIAVKGQKVMLKVETRGRLFSKGGQLVEFFVEGRSIGKNLSGGDGMGFKAYTPAKTGLFQTMARSGGDEGRGLLLSLEGDSAIVFVDVEGGLSEGPFLVKPRQGSRKAIEEMEKRYPLVLLQTSFVGLRVIKGWLEEYEFVGFPVVPWREGAAVDEIVKKGLKIKALIGGSEVIPWAQQHGSMAFTFEDGAGGERVKSWEEIREKLE